MKCVIYGKEIENIFDSNNPDQVSKLGRCCSDCDYAFVIPARMQRLGAGLPARLADEAARA